MFNEKSVVANVWADAVRSGNKSIEEVPNLSNLILIVTQILAKDVPQPTA